MRIFVLMGSPRKKDSYQISKLIERTIKQKGDVAFEYVYLKDLSIEDCRGCSLCLTKGENLCPIKDDLDMLKTKLLEADGIIFASPVYAYQVTGSFKRVVDRLSYLFHRPELVGKPALTLVTTGGGGQKEVTKYLNMTACGWGCHVISNIEVISPSFFKEDGSNKFFNQTYYDKCTKNIEAISQSFYEAMAHKSLPKPSFYQIYLFHGLRSKTYMSQVDYIYWKNKGWLDSTYYYDVKIGPIKRLFGFAIDEIIKYMWRKMQSPSQS